MIKKIIMIYVETILFMLNNHINLPEESDFGQYILE